MSETTQGGPSPRRRRWVNWVVLVLLIGGFLVIFSLRASRFSRPQRHPAVGSRLPVLNLSPLTGQSTAVKLGDLKGKVCLVNFWLADCPPCQRELPELDALAKSLAGSADFRLLAVSCGEEDPDRLRVSSTALLAHLKVDLPTYADPGRLTRRAYNRVAGLRFYPTTFLLDRDGVIRAIWEGYQSKATAEMETLARQLLEKK